MTRNEAIDWLKAISFVSDPHITEAINMAIESLSADSVRFEVYRDIYVKYMNLKHKTEWIPVSERLPEEDKDVLVTVYFKGLEQRHKTGWNDHIKPKHYVEVASQINGEWHSYSDEYKVARNRHEVLAWMPLPKPYREDGEIEE